MKKHTLCGKIFRLQLIAVAMSKKHKDEIMSHFTVKSGNTFPLGASPVSGGVQFSTVCADETECGIVLISKKNTNEKYRIPFPQGCRMGNIVSMIVENISSEDYAYRFYFGDAEYVDPYSVKILVSLCILFELFFSIK